MRVFSSQEATALLPVIRPLIAELLRVRRDLAIGLLEVEAAMHMQAEQAINARAATLANNVRAVQLRIVDLIEKIQGYGCVVKDIDLGLIDFPALREDRLVNLCWKIDEQQIDFWHGMDEGFAARKPLNRR
ncbi:MAG TPA: DUF2203 domain-containing protein [Candidatus Eremiobacteraceae bacterium]|nr:DUF2203 domain-containing protein [Candidatus Eremiobacteraceae bacterium]